MEQFLKDINGAIPSRKCSIKIPAKWPLYVLKKEIYYQEWKWLGPLHICTYLIYLFLGFIRNDKLTVHKRRAHTGEKPYVCDQCPWRGVDSSSLIHHKKKHTKQPKTG